MHVYIYYVAFFKKVSRQKIYSTYLSAKHIHNVNKMGKNRKEEEESLTFWFAGTWFPSGSTRWPEAGQFRWLPTGAEKIDKIKL